jgi:hypothetical protein
VGKLGTNGRANDPNRNLKERLAAIKIHAGIIRRAARRTEPLDKAAVVEQLDLIDRHVAQATQLVGENSPSLN